MGVIVNEFMVIDIVVEFGVVVIKGQKLVEFESDKLVFEFEVLCIGMICLVVGWVGDIIVFGVFFLCIEISDVLLKYLEVKGGILVVQVFFGVVKVLVFVVIVVMNGYVVLKMIVVVVVVLVVCVVLQLVLVIQVMFVCSGIQWMLCVIKFV